MERKIGLWIGIIIGVIILASVIIYFGFVKLSFTGLGDVYDSDWYSIGSYSVSLSADTTNSLTLPLSTWGADLKDNRVQRYDIIWANEGKVLNKNCSISVNAYSKLTGGTTYSETIGKASISNGVLLCKLLVGANTLCGHYKCTYYSPGIRWTFIDPPLITFYRFSDNQCNQISILESEKTANDYYTLDECEENIILEPTPPLPSGWSKFWTSIKNLFCKLLPFLCS